MIVSPSPVNSSVNDWWMTDELSIKITFTHTQTHITRQWTRYLSFCMSHYSPVDLLPHVLYESLLACGPVTSRSVWVITRLWTCYLTFSLSHYLPVDLLPHVQSESLLACGPVTSRSVSWRRVATWLIDSARLYYFCLSCVVFIIFYSHAPFSCQYWQFNQLLV